MDWPIGIERDDRWECEWRIKYVGRKSRVWTKEWNSYDIKDDRGIYKCVLYPNGYNHPHLILYGRCIESKCHSYNIHIYRHLSMDENVLRYTQHVCCVFRATPIKCAITLQADWTRIVDRNQFRRNPLHSNFDTNIFLFFLFLLCKSLDCIWPLNGWIYYFHSA